MFVRVFATLLASVQLLLVLGQQTTQQTAFVHPLTNMPPPSDDVDTSYFYPTVTDNKLPIGETVTILCHFSNEGSNPLNISAIMGSLNFVHDFKHHFQNYSYKPFGLVVKGGEEVTLQYQFEIHPDLEPVEYTLAHTVFYESDREAFSTTFYNQTVELFTPIVDLDAATVLQLSFSFLFVIFVGVLTYLACSPEKTAEVLGKAKTAADDLQEETWENSVTFVQPKKITGKRK